jgi:DNA-3-methyladenine glycosylase II
MDRWDGRTYRRAIIIAGNPAEVAVTQIGKIENPSLRVTITTTTHLPDAGQATMAFLEKVLGTNVDLSQFYHFAERNSELKPLMERFQGFKPPLFPSVFEALVNGITCQQLTLTLGIRLLNRLTSEYGQKMELSGGLVSVFPRPVDLAALKPADFRALGYSRQKGKALIELSNSIIEGKVGLDGLECMNDETAFETLNELRGVGRWTSEYVMLRGLGRVHVFPADDVGGRRSLQRWLNIEQRLNYDETRKVLSTWKSYGGLLYFHLLLDRLWKEGVLDD